MAAAGACVTALALGVVVGLPARQQTQAPCPPATAAASGRPGTGSWQSGKGIVSVSGTAGRAALSAAAQQLHWGQHVAAQGRQGLGSGWGPQPATPTAPTGAPTTYTTSNTQT
jgi:hypothetical protein